VRQLAGMDVEVGATHAAGVDAQQQLARAGLGRLDFPLGQWRARPVEHHGAHDRSLRPAP